MRRARVLVVEDEAAIRAGLCDALVYHGFDVDVAEDGTAGLELATSGRYDLVLLDVMLPGPDGFEICNRIRSIDKRQPVIMLTAKTSDEDIINGLSLGADDYVAKPFSVAQVILRIKAVLRRAGVDHYNEARIRLADDFFIDTENLTGQRDQRQLQFTRREIEILSYLNANTERAVSRDELLNKVWGYSRHVAIETRTVDIHIAKLRRKIESDPASPEFLLTVRGAGYRLVVQV